jgi:hypothetical protein
MPWANQCCTRPIRRQAKRLPGTPSLPDVTYIPATILSLLTNPIHRRSTKHLLKHNSVLLWPFRA